MLQLLLFGVQDLRNSLMDLSSMVWAGLAKSFRIEKDPNKKMEMKGEEEARKRNKFGIGIYKRESSESL
ncbi:hypothetical protein RIF29_24802 [Crotalaria pallida]|uniref:Uncharacterized protein n=1 Tax=Crotalaria pallida TaxID=3830 RepID=A0AAN9EKD5_CROPI